MKKCVLVVDDDAVVRLALKRYFTERNIDVAEAGTVAEAQIAFRSRRPDVAIVDYELPDGDALQLLERFRAVNPDCAVVVLTGHGSIDLAVRAIQEGASQFLTKPVELPALETVVQRLMEADSIRRQDLVRRKADAADSLDPFAGTSNAIRQLAARVEKVLASDTPILIQGETGSGKGILARWIHENSPRARQPFVDLNCAGLSREFLDTELFGHEKGAFTGAVAAKQGLFEVAHGGTLFLDEIGDVDMQVQPKLLKVVEEKRFRHLGEVTDRTVDVRLIGATHHDLDKLVAEKRFRADLYFRISTIPLVLPTLRDRKEDIPDLTRHIFERLARKVGRPDASLSDAAINRLQEYSWPGNLRELRNALERALLLSDSRELGPDDLQLSSRSHGDGGDADLSLTLDEVERRHIERVLNSEQGRVDRTAERLGVARSTLYTKIKQYGIVVGK